VAGCICFTFFRSGRGDVLCVEGSAAFPYLQKMLERPERGQAIFSGRLYAIDAGSENRGRKQTRCRVRESGPGRLLADEALVRATRAGQSRASDALARRYYPSVLAYLIRQVGDLERAQDLAQEAFYTAFRTLPRLRTPRLFAAWLYRIVATTVAAAYRRQRRTPPTLSLDRLPTPPATPPPTDTRLLVSQILATISRADRNLLIMDGIWGLTEREIAASLGISRAAARKRLQRVKERFRARYAVGE